MRERKPESLSLHAVDAARGQESHERHDGSHATNRARFVELPLHSEHTLYVVTGFDAGIREKVALGPELWKSSLAHAASAGNAPGTLAEL